MSNLRKTLAGVLACAAGIALLANAASATPATHALALKNAVPNATETVRWGGGWHGGGWHGGGWHGGWHRGWGWGGFAAGAIIGGALASPYYYGGYYPYGYPYYAPPPSGYYGGGYGGPAGGDAAAYCAQRYRSYDPASGTFLGFDGARHPCP
jgi:hypothetical protein